MNRNNNKAMLVTGAARALGLRAEAVLHQLPVDDHPAILLPMGSDVATGDELIAVVEPLGPRLAKHGPAVLVVAVANGRVEYASLADAAPERIDVRAFARALAKLGITTNELADAMDMATVSEVMPA